MTDCYYNGYHSESYQELPEKKPNMRNYSHVSTAIDLSAESSSGSLLKSDLNKVDDLRKLLESSKDSLRLDAMKKIIAIKKLVYVYLTRYAEEKEDLALLSISSFQKALKDSNQLIRASALRVLSSIRILSISPLILQAIRDCSVDISAYVRKTAAHAIPKLYALDESLKDELVIIISKLLGDKTTLVLGSAMIAFEEVCPDKIDLIHINYRNICRLMLDVDEWGQVTIINCLTRYCRNQFISPEKISQLKTNQKVEDNTNEEIDSNNKSDCAIQESLSLSNTDENEKNDSSRDIEDEGYVRDYRLLMNCSRPLLQSQNSAVVVSVCQLFYHCGSKTEDFPLVVKALTRLLSESKEVQIVVLENILTIAQSQPDLLENYLKLFFIFNKDPLIIKVKKLSILTLLGNESNSAFILREFQAYVLSSCEEFVKQVIRSIGNLALKVPSVCETCLAGLIRLISKNNQVIVSESIIVLRSLLQVKSSRHTDIIRQLASMLNTITISEAKSAIFWLVGEYSAVIPQLTPDILREMAKTFPKQDIAVKYQVLNLAAKLYASENEQVKQLVFYVFEMARYDPDYDLRDKSRMLKALCCIGNSLENDSENCLTETFPIKRKLCKKSKRILLSVKPRQQVTNEEDSRKPSAFRLGSLSHFLKQEVSGYQSLDDWPDFPPDPSVRDISEIQKTEVENSLDQKQNSEEASHLFKYSLSEEEDEVEIATEPQPNNKSVTLESSSQSETEPDSDLDEDTSNINVLEQSLTDSSSSDDSY